MTRRGSIDTATADGRSQRAEAKRQARREGILKAAVRLFSKRGYHATSVSDVIEAAGISRGTFYLYFDGKDALFLDLMELFIEEITEVVEVVDPDGPDPAGKIYENVRRVADVVFDNEDLAVLVLREEMGVNADVNEKLARLYGFLHEMVEGALVNGAKGGLIRRVNAPIVATALIGAIKQVFYRHLVVEDLGELDRQAVTETLVGLSLRGLLTAP